MFCQLCWSCFTFHTVYTSQFLKGRHLCWLTENMATCLHTQLNSSGFDSTWLARPLSPYSLSFNSSNEYLCRQEFPKKKYIYFELFCLNPWHWLCSYSRATGTFLTFQCLVPLYLFIYDNAFTLYLPMIHRPDGHSTNVPTVLQPIF